AQEVSGPGSSAAYFAGRRQRPGHPCRAARPRLVELSAEGGDPRAEQATDPLLSARTRTRGNRGGGAGHLQAVQGDEVGRLPDPQVADAALWAELVRGESRALGELFDRYSRQVYNFAFRRTASWVLAEEVTQATFVSAWRRSRSVEGRFTTGRGWLFGIAENECRNAVRGAIRAGRLQSRLLDVAETGAVADPADLVPERIDAERRMAAVRHALRRLPIHEQRTIELVVWSGFSTAEAATALGVAEGTVKSRLSRARSRLSQLTDTPLLGELL
ncbi:MAG: RNA polymerase sigma factor, partial [Janthinobacterium lividum]